MWVLPWFALALLFACTSVSGGPDGDDSGDTSFAACPTQPTIAWLSEPNAAPLTDGDSVVMQHGPQGGWHIGVGAGIRGHRVLLMHPFVELVSTGEQLAGDDNAFELSLWDWERGTCDGVMSGMIAYLNDRDGEDQASICGLVGEEMRLRLVVTDPEGLATDELSVLVVAEADPTDPCD